LVASKVTLQGQTKILICDSVGGPAFFIVHMASAERLVTVIVGSDGVPLKLVDVRASKVIPWPLIDAIPP
jgi:hypothetical protein